jgi:C4-dicarboxylate transporter, DctQ subunit
MTAGAKFMKPENGRKSVFDRIVDVFAAMGCLLIAGTMFLVCLDVIWNLVCGRSLTWSTEIVEYSMLWMTFLGSAWVLRNNAHIRMDMVTDRISPHSRHLLAAITSYLGAVICLLLTYFGARVTLHAFQTGYRLMTYLEIPSAYINLIIPLGFLMICLEFIVRGNHSIRSYRA